MTSADSPKKRKRITSSHPTRRMPLHPAEMGPSDPTLDSVTQQQREAEVLAKFNLVLKDAKASEEYGQYRRDLLKVEEENAWDREAKPKSDSTSEQDRVEQRAALIVHEVREYERIVTFGNLASESLPDVEDQDMGGQYLTNKQRIDTESKLFEISKMVPKGALLHLHFNAELHPEVLLVRARTMKNMYIRSIQRIQDERQLATTELIFNVLDPDTVNPNVDIFSMDYPLITTPGDLKKEDFQKQIWMPWAKFQDEFEKRFPGQYRQQEPETFREGPHHCGDVVPLALRPAENWLRSKMVLSQEEAYRPDQTVNGYVWCYSRQSSTDMKTASGLDSTKPRGLLKGY
jgi:adenosine deaminase CECR1